MITQYFDFYTDCLFQFCKLKLPSIYTSINEEIYLICENKLSINKFHNKYNFCYLYYLPYFPPYSCSLFTW